MTEIDWDEPAEYVAERLREAIATEPNVYEHGITVTVAGGRVLLTGSASTPTQRQAVTDLVRRLTPADIEVVNDVEVPSTSQPNSAEDLDIAGSAKPRPRAGGGGVGQD